ncbi:hypothetical protein CL633_01505 [bacterium]|nr:hypothetical protein [bacterium]
MADAIGFGFTVFGNDIVVSQIFSDNRKELYLHVAEKESESSYRVSAGEVAKCLKLDPRDLKEVPHSQNEQGVREFEIRI